MDARMILWMTAATAFFGVEAEQPVAIQRKDSKEAKTNIVIEVTASPITQEERIEKDGADQVVVGRAQIARLSAMDLQTALRQVPGVSISRYSPVGSYGGGQGGSVYVRGLGTARPGSELRIYQDGVPRESGVWGHPLMDSVPIDFAEQITVNKNPRPQAYPDTFAAIDMDTLRRYTPGYETELNLAYGRYNTLIGSAATGGKIDDFDYYGGAAYKYSEGARRHGSAELENEFARAGWDLSSHDHLGYVYQHTDSWVEDPGPKHGTTPERDRFDLTTDVHSLRLDSDHDWMKGYSLVYFEDGNIDWWKDHLSDGVMKSPAGDSETDWHNWGFRSAYDFIFDDLTLTAALDSWTEGGSTKNKLASNGKKVWGFDSRLFTTAPYLGARYDIHVSDDWTLTPSAGARYYWNNTYDNEWAPCGALTLHKDDDLQFFVNSARGVHYPGIYMRGTSPNTWRDLDAESIDTTETGVKAKVGDKADIMAAWFYTDASDRMESTTSGYINTGSMRADGLEVNAHVYPTKELTLFAGGTYTDPQTHPVSRLPDWTATAGASWKVFEYVRWDIDAEYIGTQNAYSVRTQNPSLEKLDGDVMFNTRLALDMKAFSKLTGELYVAVENFTDCHHEYYPDYPMPGAMWYTGMKLKF
jgi:outer membrane cobalamin receptor